MTKIKLLIILMTFMGNSIFCAYFYCVTTNGAPHYFNPTTTIKYNVLKESLTDGKSINLGDRQYVVTNADISGGKFSSLFGAPQVYFVFPSQPKKISEVQDLVSDIKEQCKKVIESRGLSDQIFKEVRISDSYVSGAGILQTGYPAVFLNYPITPDKQNIFRIAE